MYHQKSYCIFITLWTLAFTVWSTHVINKYAGDKLRMFLTGPIEESTPVEWRESNRRPGLKMVVFPVSREYAVMVPTWKGLPEEAPFAEQKLRVDRSSGSALISNEWGWVFGIARIFVPTKLFYIVVIASLVTVALWLPFFSGKSSLDRHRERVRRRRRHQKASKFPVIWIKVVSILFLLVSASVAWWAIASVIPSGNLIAGVILIVLALAHFPVLIGMLCNKPSARTMMMVLPWTWIPVVPIGTVLAIITLAALPNLPELESRHRHRE